MKVARNFLDSGFVGEHQLSHQTPNSDDRTLPSYARDLRVVGQLLERREVVSADLVWVADTYVIRGITRSNGKSRALGWLSRLSITRVGAILRGELRRSLRSEVLDLRYPLEEIIKFDHMAQSKRSGSDRMPDPYSVSHILRSAGAYLDGRTNSSLIGISLKNRWLTIRFETAEGNPEEAKQDIEYFYDYWVKMYLRRGSRAKISSSSRSIVSGFWEDEKRR